MPRLEIFNIDICITGSDHYNEGDFIVRQELIKKYSLKAKPHKALYSQVVLGRDGDVMGNQEEMLRQWKEMISCGYLMKILMKKLLKLDRGLIDTFQNR